MAQLVLTSDTLAGTPATGTLEYNGQFFGTDSAAARAQMQRITLSTAVATTSGTSIDFTSIPAWVKRITVMFAGVSTNGSSVKQVQLGAGSVTTSGYLSTSSVLSGATSTTSLTSGFVLNSTNTTDVISGSYVITLISGSTWIGSVTAKAATNITFVGGGDVTLSGTLDRIRLTTANGTDAFDAGSVNILYEG